MRNDENLRFCSNLERTVWTNGHGLPVAGLRQRCPPTVLNADLSIGTGHGVMNLARALKNAPQDKGRLMLDSALQMVDSMRWDRSKKTARRPERRVIPLGPEQVKPMVFDETIA